MSKGKVPATYTCAQRGEWGPYHVLVPGPTTGRDRWGPTRDRGKDKTLCGVQLTEMWERDTSGIEPEQVECKRCRAILKKQGKLGQDEDSHTGGKMKLLTEELKQRIPPIRSTEGEKDPTVQAKFFDPCGSWTWFVLEGSALVDDGEGNLSYVPLDEMPDEVVDVEFFGLVKGFANELGPFMLNELESVKGPFGLGIERDKFFTPKPLSEVWDEWPFE